MGGYFGKLNMYTGKFLSVNCNSKTHMCNRKYTVKAKMEENTKRYPDSILVHCKCLQEFAGLLWGNQSAGISNLQGLHVTCFPCNLFKAKTTIIVGNMIYRSTMGIPCIYYRE